MAGFYNDRDTEGMQRFLYAVADLDREPFLDLEPAGVGLHDAGYLAETCDFTIGDIGYMAFSYEGQQVMLAGRIKVNVLYQHHLPVLFFEHGLLDDVLAVLLITLGEELERFSYAFGGLQEPFAFRILSQKAQNLFYMSGNTLCDNGVVFVCTLVCHGYEFQYAKVAKNYLFKKREKTLAE